ncbi:MAG TPA: hypothetical protein ENO28_13155 [Bacteroidetes bacterium]|nr:hypothetical protein [Bacteroidota bacterium]
MRKICTLCITAFYLLLTTGAYACALHCATDLLAERFSIQQQAAHSGSEDEGGENDELCKSGDCHCCYHHGSYVVSENFSRDPVFDFTNIVTGVIPSQKVWEVYRAEFTLPVLSWPRATGPPFLSSYPIYILSRSLLI